MKKLYFKQKVFKITDHYEIYNENQEPLYKVDQDFTFIGYNAGVAGLHGQGDFTIKRKVPTLLPEYNVEFTDGEHAVIKSRWSFLKARIDIRMGDVHLFVKGNIWGYNYDVIRMDRPGEQLAAHVEEKFLTWGDTYEIRVHDVSLEQLIVAAAIAIDNIKNSQSK